LSNNAELIFDKNKNIIKYIYIATLSKKYKQNENSKIKPAYTDKEYELLLDYFEHQNYEMFLFIQFLWNTGARCGEALEIQLSDINLEKKPYICI